MRNTSAHDGSAPWEARYSRKQAHRARGLADLEARAGPVCAEIDARLGGQESVRILELGCGYGIALLDLAARYGARVQSVGINLHAEDGQDAILRREAAARGIDVTTRPDALPTLLHVDVAQGVPLPDDHFDVVVSQVAWQYFRNKIGVLREVIRVLRPDGIGMIEADEFDAKLPPEYGRLVEIWDERRLVPFEEYGARYGTRMVPTAHGRALRVLKDAAFGVDLDPRVEIDANDIDARWDGVKCVYAVERR